MLKFHPGTTTPSDAIFRRSQPGPQPGLDYWTGRASAPGFQPALERDHWAFTAWGRCQMKATIWTWRRFSNCEQIGLSPHGVSPFGLLKLRQAERRGATRCRPFSSPRSPRRHRTSRSCPDCAPRTMITALVLLCAKRVDSLEAGCFKGFGTGSSRGEWKRACPRGDPFSPEAAATCCRKVPNPGCEVLQELWLK